VLSISYNLKFLIQNGYKHLNYQNCPAQYALITLINPTQTLYISFTKDSKNDSELAKRLYSSNNLRSTDNLVWFHFFHQVTEKSYPCLGIKLD